LKNKAITMMIELMITLRDIEEKFKTSDDDDNCEASGPKYICIGN